MTDASFGIELQPDNESQGGFVIMDRRSLLKLLGAATASSFTHPSWTQGPQQITSGSFAGTRDSLRKYKIPEWLGQSKFGIWAHWGPQSAIGDGDWYARNMYIQGSPQYQYHLNRFGPQSKVGYKDLIHLFSADRWDPGALMDLYVQAGAKYFFSMGVHHDNFDMWNSKYQPRWNAAATGPKKDIVGLWAQAARKRGLRFGVSDHLSNSYDWFAPAHTSDKTGSLAGVPYDGSDPAFADLYHNYTGEPYSFVDTAKPMGRVAPGRWKQQYFRRIKDLIDQHYPDMLYTDGGIPFEEFGLGLVAEEYNTSASAHGGLVESVYFSKVVAECSIGTCVLDRERGVVDGIWPDPWQTDTCIGDWHYKKGIQYKSAKKVIDLLVDIVSKNGNLLLNFPLPASGELDADERVTLQGITDWIRVNGEAIFNSRPWKIHGEGPGTMIKAEPGMNEGQMPDLTAQDVRFTTKDGLLYAFVQGWPTSLLTIKALGLMSDQKPGRVIAVEMLGVSALLKFKQQDAAMEVAPPERRPAAAATGVTLKIRFA
jgi:alpha-L-fucosidase